MRAQQGSVSSRVMLALLVVGMAFGILVSVRLDWLPFLRAEKSLPQQRPSAAADAVPQASTGAASNAAGAFEAAFIDAAAKVGPAVVSVSTEQTAKVQRAPMRFRGGSPFGQDEFFDQFFRDFFDQMPQQEFHRSGLGSGVIIDPRGFILTNEHVVDQADKITVTLPDGREFTGTVKGTDPRSDLAVIKIEAQQLPVAALGDSSRLKIGQWAIAVGNPFGFIVRNPEPTITVGVVSALHRDLPRTQQRDRNYTDLIQTDAAINPGNSGGPLVNLHGEIVGINVAIFSTSGGSEGIGFAIPVNRARDIVANLIEGKKVVYGWLGIQLQDLTPEVAAYYGLPQAEGALVYQVIPDSPAAKAGFQEGDVIRAFDGERIASTRDLVNRVGSTPVGQRAPAEVLRNKKTVTITVQIGERPGDLDELSVVAPGVQRWRGLQVSDVTPELAQQGEIPPGTTGVIVTNVEPGSPAAMARLRPGDVINAVNHQVVRNTAEFARATQHLTGNCLLRTLRGYVVIHPTVE